MTIHLEHDRVLRTVSDLRVAADSLSHERDRADGRVGRLLDGGWRGEAATGYQDAWTRWRDGCGDVVRGLGAMAELLAAVERDVQQRDAESQADLDAVSARIVERLS